MNPKQTLFIDIETFRSSIPPSRDEIKVPGNYSKPESIQKYIDENLEEEWNKTALNSLKGQIICIGYAIDDEPVQIISGTEQEIMNELERIVLNNSFLDWVGHNILGFDLPYIYHRAIKFGNKKLRTVIPKGRYPKGVFDTMVEFAGSDYSKRYSLKDICNFLGIDNGKDEIDGSMVGGLWLAGEKEKVLEYCKKDVEILREVYYRIER
jgi:predicted PolB exonuclease-like 3'-5' exonuclease